MTHSERIRAATDAVVAAAKAWRADYPQLAPPQEINRIARSIGVPDDPRYAALLAVDALLALEAATCGECGGSGNGSMAGNDFTGYAISCPACHGTGAKPEVTT